MPTDIDNTPMFAQFPNITVGSLVKNEKVRAAFNIGVAIQLGDPMILEALLAGACYNANLNKDK